MYQKNYHIFFILLTYASNSLLFMVIFGLFYYSKKLDKERMIIRTNFYNVRSLRPVNPRKWKSRS